MRIRIGASEAGFNKCRCLLFLFAVHGILLCFTSCRGSHAIAGSVDHSRWLVSVVNRSGDSKLSYDQFLEFELKDRQWFRIVTGRAQAEMLRAQLVGAHLGNEIIIQPIK